MSATDLLPEVKPHLGNADDNQRFTTRRAKAIVATGSGSPDDVRDEAPSLEGSTGNAAPRAAQDAEDASIRSHFEAVAAGESLHKRRSA